MKLYQTVARELEDMIRGGTLRPGDQLPSVRSLCLTRGVSPATVLHAYASLEAMQLIDAKARSGYYVSLKPSAVPSPALSAPAAKSTRVLVSDLVFDTLEASRDRRVVPLGSAFPSPLLFPFKKLARYLGRAARHMDPWSTTENLPPGNVELRRLIARRYLRLGMTVGMEEIVITAGALEALNLSLSVVTQPGDTIAIESPTFYGCLQAAERLALNVVEIPTHPGEGVDLEALGRAIAKHPLRACWFMITLQHPTGATAPARNKRQLVELLARRDIPLIEDDVYGDLQFAATPSAPAKAFDRKGLVLHCGSFSKCLAPGYRLGWVAAGHFAQRVSRAKVESSLSTSLPVQVGVAQMLQVGGYDSHLAKLRMALEGQQAAALKSLQRHFPAGYKVAQPGGGYFLWIECATRVDSLELHRLALASGVSIAPGPMFSARREFRHFIRLNCGHPWNSEMDRAVAKLSALVRRFG